MPESLAKSQYRWPTALQGPLQDAYDTKLQGWDYIMQPKFAHTVADLNLFMQGRRLSSVSWLDFFPLVGVLRGAEEGSVLIVDVGGGL